MASYQHTRYAHCNGPRQGVYPLQQLEHYRTVSWRATQLKGPAESYRQRARIESAVILPGPPALPPRPLRRSTTSVSCGSEKGATKLQTDQKRQVATSESQTKGLPSNSQFFLKTTSMSMQSRPVQKERTTPPVKPSTPPARSYSYLDPTKVNGDPAFELRLAQIAQHEANTVKQEEWHKSKRNISRPSSSKGLNSSKPSSARGSLSSRPSSARSVAGTTSSSRFRRTSTNPPTHSKRCTSARSHRPSLPSTISTHQYSNDIHSPPSSIHKTVSAMELKQTETRSIVQAPPSNQETSESEVNRPPKTPKEFLPETSPTQDSECEGEPIPDCKELTQAQPANVSEDPSASEDDLNVTSDLGLSIDSLHLSGEDLSLDEDNIVQPGEPNKPVLIKPSITFDIDITPPSSQRRSHKKKSVPSNSSKHRVLCN